ncbi:MAG: glycoside hydrolase family 9 protein [Lachnospiraceae bacterium]|nr:glycoside hydrolase family 9 protein [Candidatus Colinaster scatohippi]
MKKNIKIIISILLLFSLLLGCVGCGKTGAETGLDNIAKESVTETTSASVEASETEVVEEIATVTDSDAETEEEDIQIVGKNLLDNGDFHSELSRWSSYIAKGGNGVFTAPGGEGKVKINNSGKVNYAVQIYYDGFALKKGGVYEFKFDICSTIPRNIEARIQINGGDYHAYVLNYYDITPDMTTYSCTFTMEEGSDPAPRLCINLGTPKDQEVLEEHVVRIDNVAVTLVDDSGIEKIQTEDRTVGINANQIGYLPEGYKTAVSSVVKANDSFDIVEKSSGKVVYSGNFGPETVSLAAGEKVCLADFSDFKTPGTYIIKSGESSSYEFTIGEDVYDELLKKTFLFLYSQRCGIETTKELAGQFAHPECHTGTAVVYGTNETKAVQGGWHDAGDYGRYVVPGAVTVADLFRTYEDATELWDSDFGDSIGIPESGNKIPDILDEARFELEWMLDMQDNKTGGVYHKISCYEFPGFVMPQDEKEQLVLSPVSNAATADFAAVMADASVIYKEIDSNFADICLKAALKAWSYLETSPVGVGYRNPDDILTGEYPDARDTDERYWAAIELYKATGDEKYKNYYNDIISNYVMHGYGWAQISSYGNMSYLNSSIKEDNYASIIKNDVSRKSDELYECVLTDGYMCALGKDFSWGSNMTVCNDSRILLDGYNLTGNDKYLKAAEVQLTYLLGENPLSYCYVTGFGSVSPTHVHHRPSMATGYVLAGMLVGGPNMNLEDPYAKAVLYGLPGAKCYVDNEQSFSTNEVTIYWNSPMIYLLSYYINR